MAEEKAEFYAHSKEGVPLAQWQTLDQHLRGTAEKCARFAAVFSSVELARLAGLWHDIGKYQANFQQKLLGRLDYVEHSGAGAALAWEKFSTKGLPVAFAIAGHHTGLANYTESGSELPTPLKERIIENARVLSEILPWMSPELIAVGSPDLPRFLRVNQSTDAARLKRNSELWVRFLFSILVDSDRLDTEEFLAPDTYKRRTERFPPLEELATRLGRHIENKVSQLRDDARNSKVNLARAHALKRCRDASHSPPGLFSLTVPTGGGKTLSAMAFAINHAVQHDLRRIIVVIPYTSIIEQNAAEYKQALGEDNVIEHHSAFEDVRDKSEARDDLHLRQTLATENWDAPIIVTTTVQFFETMFSSHPSRCRKLHNVAKSVIILDEVQTLPLGLLSPILEGIQELVTNYGCSVVLSTATPPALIERPGFPGLRNAMPIVADSQRLASDLQRVDYVWPQPGVSTGWPELAEALGNEKQVMAIVHRRQDARQLAKEVTRLVGTESVHHLSALMCPTHRLETIKEIRTALENRQPCRVISTQLVEAGVDLDFPVVYRALGGLDSIVQAAGRCNREGRMDKGKVIVFRATTAPPPGTPKRALQIMETMLASREPLDPETPESIEKFFRSLYFSENLDSQDIQRERAQLNFANVGQKFRLIEDDFTVNVIVPYGKSADLLKTLRREGPSREVYRSLQRYTVSIYPDSFRQLERSGAIEKIAEGLFTLTSGFEQLYDKMFGLMVGDIPPGGGAVFG